MRTIREWLQQHGLGEWAEVFERQQIDLDALRYLTDAELKELELPIGPRLKLKAAIQGLDPRAATPAGGAPIGHPFEPQASAERRQLTVLFCDLVGSTELSHRLGPEEYRELVRGYQDACSTVVARYDGHIAQYLGDGLLVYFGYPRAHEDDAQRAVRAGLGIVDAVSALSLPAGPLRVRVGIETGLVVVGDVGARGSQEQLALGDTPNRAARLQALGSPGSVVLGDGTRRLVAGSFELRDLGLQSLKGIAEPVQVWEARAERRAESRFEAASAGRIAPMVGRDLEFSVVLHAWQRARSGRGQVVLLCGEPGIGKSRILQALRESVSAEGFSPWQYQCSPYFTNSALFPAIDQLERMLQFDRQEPAAARLDKLSGWLSELARSELDANLIGRLLSLPAEARYGALDMAPQKQKEGTIRALTDAIEAAAGGQTLLILFEDLHWADPTTLEFLETLLGRLERLAVLLLATYRPEFKSPWIGQPSVTALTLSRLDPAQTRAIVDRITGGRSLPDEVLAQIVDKTDGIPLFVEELTKTVVESTLLTRGETGYTLAGPLPALAIPATLRDSLMARLDRLAPVKDLAQIAACIGREFDEELLGRVAPLSAPELRRALDQLVGSELVLLRGQPPHHSYVFKHALIQDAAYDSLLKSRRAQVHGQIAQALEEGFGEIVAAQPERLAHHFTEAGLAERAIPYWHKAGQLALSRMALQDTIAHLDRGVALLQQVPASAARDGYELDLSTILGAAWMAHRGWAHPNVASNLERAWSLEQALNRSDHMMPILYGLSMYRMCVGQVRESMCLAERILHEGERGNIDDMRMLGHVAVEVTSYFHGEFTPIDSHAQAILTRYDPARHRHIADLITTDPKTYALIYQAFAQWVRGYPERSARTLEAGVQHSRARGHLFDLAWTLQFVAKHYDVYRRQPEVCAARLDEFERLVHEQRIYFMEQIIGPICRAAWLLIDDRPRESSALFRESIPRWTDVGLGIDVPYYRTLHAQSAALAGERAAALSLIDEVLQQIERPGWEEKCIYAEALRTKAWIFQLGNDLAGAEATYRAAIEVARQQQAKSWELRAATSYAGLLKDQSRRREARESLEPVYRWFTEGFDTRDLKEAKALLETLGS